MSTPVTVRLKMDAKRRPTIPAAVLDAAGVGPGEDLVARVEGPGRIVLESSASILTALQAAVAAGLAAQDRASAAPSATGAEGDASGDGAESSPATQGRSLVQELFADRAADIARENVRYPDLVPTAQGGAGNPESTGAGKDGKDSADGVRGTTRDETSADAAGGAAPLSEGIDDPSNGAS